MRCETKLQNHFNWRQLVSYASTIGNGSNDFYRDKNAVNYFEAKGNDIEGLSAL